MGLKRKTFELYVLPAILTLVLFLPHILFLTNRYVDLERIYVRAALELAQHGFNANLSEYFSMIANPIFGLLFLAGSYKVLGESALISRLAILSVALVFTLFLYFFLRKRVGVFISFVAALLVVVNPAFIVYSQYVHTDVPFMVFSATSLLLLLFVHSARGEIASSIMLGISLATKYVTVVLFPVVFVYSLIKSRVAGHSPGQMLPALTRFNIWYFTLSLLVSMPVMLIVFRFQNALVPRQSELVQTLSAGMLIPRFLAYLLWLGLLIGPSCLFSLWDLWQKIGKARFALLLAGLVGLTLIASLFLPISSLHQQEFTFGEMNLGWVESVVPSSYLSVAFFLILLVAELFLASLTFDFIYSKDNLTRGLCLWIVLPILLMSFIRGANRYMLVVLVPLSLYMALVARNSDPNHKRLWVPAVLVLHALIFLAVGFYSLYYLQQRGLAG